MNSPISIRFPEAINARLADIAAISGKSRSAIVRQVLEDHLDDLEDIYHSIQAMEKNDKTWTLDELRARYQDKKS